MSSKRLWTQVPQKPTCMSGSRVNDRHLILHPTTSKPGWTVRRVKALMRPPPELQEWVVDRRMNKSRAGHDNPATAAPIDLEAAAPSASSQMQGTLF